MLAGFFNFCISYPQLSLACHNKWNDISNIKVMNHHQKWINIQMHSSASMHYFHLSWLCNKHKCVCACVQWQNSGGTEDCKSRMLRSKRDLDKGWAWVVLGVSFLSILLTSGISFVSGIFQKLFLEEFQESVAFTAWVTSLFSSFMQLAGEQEEKG